MTTAWLQNQSLFRPSFLLLPALTVHSTAVFSCLLSSSSFLPLDFIFFVLQGLLFSRVYRRRLMRMA